MKIKKLLFLAIVFFSFNLVAQNSHQPIGIITGTFMGTTGNLKDYPLYDVNMMPHVGIWLVTPIHGII